MVRVILLVIFYILQPAYTYTPSHYDLRMFEEINAYREQKNLPKLHWSTELYILAKQKTKHMIEFDYFSHTSPAGITLKDRLKNTHGKAENLARNFPDGGTTLQALKNSPTHDYNLVDPRSTRIGVYTENNVTTQIFGDDSIT